MRRILENACTLRLIDCPLELRRVNVRDTKKEGPLPVPSSVTRYRKRSADE